MTVHLISVGTSILDALDQPRDLLKDDQRELRDAIKAAEPTKLLQNAKNILDTHNEDASKWIASALAPAGEAVRDDKAATALAKVAEKSRLKQWPREFSAELQTYRSVADTWRPIVPQDIVILICSDTVRGLLSGLWNALALTGDLADVMYLPSPKGSGRRLRAARRRVTIVRVGGMDAGDDRGFREAMGGLGVLARDLFKYGQLDHAEEFKFGLTGGYRASVPYLIGMAEAVASIDKARLDELHAGDLMPRDGKPYPVTAYVVPEKSSKSIRLPLRRLDAEAVQRELDNFDLDDGTWRRPVKPSAGPLEGYAYESYMSSYRLTPFGFGLRALFGGPDANRPMN